MSWDEYSFVLQRYFSHVDFSPELVIVGGGTSQRAHDISPNLKLRTPIAPAVLATKRASSVMKAKLHPIIKKSTRPT